MKYRWWGGKYVGACRGGSVGVGEGHDPSALRAARVRPLAKVSLSPSMAYSWTWRPVRRNVGLMKASVH